ncbi:ExbD/TolR family protein [Marinobacter subterrani]|uniref:ExbD/TolR family protein n=1 Tax=Marinobacter subterrani TaxID=1658765 RepID=UPI0030810E7F
MARVEDALLPLINLVFLLLMFFIVAGQLADEPLPELPATTRAPERQAPQADLVVDARGNWLVAGAALGKAGLLDRLPPPQTQKPLKIAVDRGIAMAELEVLMKVLEQGGYSEVLLLTEPGE